MTISRKNIVLIPAAGIGSRMKTKVEKPLIKLANSPILIHTLKAIDNCKFIDEIILIVNPRKFIFWKKELKNYNFRTPLKIIKGGKRRQDSVYNGVKFLKKNTDIVLIHDGVRPFISSTIIKQGTEMAKKYGVSIPAVKIKPTVKEINSRNLVVKTLQRKNLREIQTPQCFQYKILKECLKSNLDEVTDEATLAEHLGFKVKVFPGSYDNIKITTSEDLILAEAILKKRTKGK